MGIIANAKQYLAKKVTDVAVKTADGVAKTAVLSPKQVERVNEKRTAYLSGKKDMQGDEAQTFISRQLGAVGVEVYQAYLEQLKTLYQPMDVAIERFDDLNRIRYFDITKWVTDPSEKNLDKLVNVYQVLSEENCNIALIYNRKQTGTQIVMAVNNTDMEQSDPAKANSFNARLVAAIKGNFPGVEILEKKNDNTYGCGIPACLESAITSSGSETSVKSVAVVSNLASDKSEDFISQSMEKLLDGIVPVSDDEEYTIVLLAKPVADQLNARNRLFELYSALAPYSSWQTSYTYNESETENSSATAGVNLGMNVGKHVGHNKTISTGAEGVGVSEGVSSGTNIGANFGVNFSRASSVTVQVGKNESLTQSYTNFGVKHTLDVIEKQLERIDASSALGMWEFASYVFAKSPVITNNVAHMYLALTQGDESYMTRAAVNLWDGQEEKDAAYTILKSVQKLRHPVFGLRESADESTLLFPSLVTPSAVLSGKELAKALNFPRKSVSGFPVFECVPFGRDVQKLSPEDVEDSRKVPLGKIYHMRSVDENKQVFLDADSLTSHVFVTGSTGAGKSNTIYQLLNELTKKKVRFLVIEPAKGEYKQVFGGHLDSSRRPDVYVYGTNFKMAPLLRLNPFSFPDEIHVLEHIDRLIEIFNACWPMYAAMPAVLKDAIEESYKSCGWNLTHSVCEPKRYPTFDTLLKKLPEIMDSSAYSKDTKGDYTGALVTRVKSLTNGINGQIFCSGEELTSEELFDRNVIVDLSRVGSMETKSLLMGILMIKLQEHRMAVADRTGETNSNLRHVTVLEEAHNLLRRTSSEQSQDSSNLQGKSVEMLANAIAEMRTYGEGFIIADQAPGLLDMAVIRNTNTKIIMRLPDESDRVLVGKAAGLTDEQIVELSKLDCGVAAVFQNHWLEAVLCKVDEFKDKQKFDYKNPQSGKIALETGCTQMNFFFEKLLGKPTTAELSDEEVDKVSAWIDGLSVQGNTKTRLRAVLGGNENLDENNRRELLYRIVNGNEFLKHAGMYAGTESARETGMRQIDQRIMEMLGVSALLAEEIRKQVFLFAANRIDRMPQHDELLYYGGIK